MSSNNKRDPINRGDYSTNALGSAVFFVARLIDPVVQYGVLKYGWGGSIVRRLGGDTLPQGPPLITNSPFDRIGLSPYRSILFAMSVGGMMKQNYHTAVLMQENMGVGFALSVGVYNTIGNLFSSLFFVCAQTSASANGENFPQTPLIAGSMMYVAGIMVELLSEQQRFNWKTDPRNKGKVYEQGLFSLSRHINYFGYTLWRSGYAIAAGGWLWGGFVAALSTLAFTKSKIPLLQQYMEEKYGDKYEHYKRKTPYVFIPWLY